MDYLSAILLAVLAPFAPLFSSPVWKNALVLLSGAILTPRQRTVTACLHAMGLSQSLRFDNFHYVLRKAKWSGLAASKILLGMLIALIPQGTRIHLSSRNPVLQGRVVHFRIWERWKPLSNTFPVLLGRGSYRCR